MKFLNRKNIPILLTLLAFIVCSQKKQDYTNMFAYETPFIRKAQSVSFFIIKVFSL